MDTQEFELFGSLDSSFGTERYPGEPFLSINHKQGYGSLYLSRTASEKLDIRKGEGILFARKGDSFFIYRCEAGTKGSYTVAQRSSGCGRCASSSHLRKGMTIGDYMLADPIHYNGLDLFELIPVSEWEERKSD
jgi:hypothetical protein